MPKKRTALVVLMAVPGLAFWVHLPIWEWVWPVLWGPGENWWPVLIEYALFFLSAILFFISSVAATVAMARKGKSYDLWIAALLNLTPTLGVLILIMSPRVN